MPKIRETIKHRIEAAELIPVDPRFMISKGCMRIKDAAVFTALSESEIRRRVADGSLPHMRDGKAVRIPVVALEEFMATRLVLRRDLVRIDSKVAVVKERAA